MSNWINEELVDTSKYQGFVYILTNTINGKKYVGKKWFTSSTTKKLSKKAIAELPVKPGRKPTKIKTTKESDWKNYWGSAKGDLATDLIKYGKENFTREILVLCDTKKACTYYEMYFQFLFRVLEFPDQFYNFNIAGTLYSKDVVGTVLV